MGNCVPIGAGDGVCAGVVLSVSSGVLAWTGATVSVGMNRGSGSTAGPPVARSVGNLSGWVPVGVVSGGRASTVGAAVVATVGAGPSDGVE